MTKTSDNSSKKYQPIAATAQKTAWGERENTALVAAIQVKERELQTLQERAIVPEQTLLNNREVEKKSFSVLQAIREASASLAEKFSSLKNRFQTFKFDSSRFFNNRVAPINVDAKAIEAPVPAKVTPAKTRRINVAPYEKGLPRYSEEGSSASEATEKTPPKYTPRKSNISAEPRSSALLSNNSTRSDSTPPDYTPQQLSNTYAYREDVRTLSPAPSYDDLFRTVDAANQAYQSRESSTDPVDQLNKTFESSTDPVAQAANLPESSIKDTNVVRPILATEVKPIETTNNTTPIATAPQFVASVTAQNETGKVQTLKEFLEESEIPNSARRANGKDGLKALEDEYKALFGKATPNTIAELSKRREDLGAINLKLATWILDNKTSDGANSDLQEFLKEFTHKEHLKIVDFIAARAVAFGEEKDSSGIGSVLLTTRATAVATELEEIKQDYLKYSANEGGNRSERPDLKVTNLKLANWITDVASNGSGKTLFAEQGNKGLLETLGTLLNTINLTDEMAKEITESSSVNRALKTQELTMPTINTSNLLAKLAKSSLPKAETAAEIPEVQHGGVTKNMDGLALIRSIAADQKEAAAKEAAKNQVDQSVQGVEVNNERKTVSFGKEQSTEIPDIDRMLREKYGKAPDTNPKANGVWPLNKGHTAELQL